MFKKPRDFVLYVKVEKEAETMLKEKIKQNQNFIKTLKKKYRSIYDIDDKDLIEDLLKRFRDEVIRYINVNYYVIKKPIIQKYFIGFEPGEQLKNYIYYKLTVLHNQKNINKTFFDNIFKSVTTFLNQCATELFREKYK